MNGARMCVGCGAFVEVGMKTEMRWTPCKLLSSAGMMTAPNICIVSSGRGELVDNSRWPGTVVFLGCVVRFDEFCLLVASAPSVSFFLSDENDVWWIRPAATVYCQRRYIHTASGFVKRPLRRKNRIPNYFFSKCQLVRGSREDFEEEVVFIPKSRCSKWEFLKVRRTAADCFDAEASRLFAGRKPCGSLTVELASPLCIFERIQFQRAKVISKIKVEITHVAT